MAAHLEGMEICDPSYSGFDAKLCQSGIDWWYDPGETGFHAATAWPEDYESLRSNVETPYYWTGVYKHTTTGESISHFNDGGLGSAGGGDWQSYFPDAYHHYHYGKNQFWVGYDPGEQHTASLQEGAGKNTFPIEATYKAVTYETCHGTTPSWAQGKSGMWNYYHAFYAPGYYQPPYGETPSANIWGTCGAIDGYEDVFEGEDTVAAQGQLEQGLTQGGCCKKITNKEKHALWGIRTVIPKQGALATALVDRKRGAEQPIFAPSEECPPEMPVSYYEQEEGYTLHPGSIMARGAGQPYNDNPFPGSIDTNGWEVGSIYDTQICYGAGAGNAVRWIGYKLYNGFPRLEYPVDGAKQNKLKTTMCEARSCETSTSLGDNDQSVQLGAGHSYATAINDQANFNGFDFFVDWHFVFRYNMDEYPDKTHNTTSGEVVSWCEGSGVEHFWTWRQCASVVNFLPWTVGSTIYACPRDYFDIPYYATMGKFGYYGVRFFNSCFRPDTELEDYNTVDKEMHYYDVFEIKADGSRETSSKQTARGLPALCGTHDAVLRINNQCRHVVYTDTSPTQRETDLVLSSFTPSYSDGLSCVDEVRFHGGSNVYATRGNYLAQDVVGTVRDWPAGVAECTMYEDPRLRKGTCSTSQYHALLNVAKNEQRLADFFAGNIGFFLWANYEHIVDSEIWKNLFHDPLCKNWDVDDNCIKWDDELLGEAELKSALLRLRQTFDSHLVSLPNFLDGADDPVILFDNANGQALFEGLTIAPTKQSSLSDLLFTNQRFEAMMREIEENPVNIFVNGKKYKRAWDDIVLNYGKFVAAAKCEEGAGLGYCKKLPPIDSQFYEHLTESKQKRLLTRYMENELRSTPRDLFPLNHITFSLDAPSGYEKSDKWGRSIYGDNVSRGSHRDPLPEIDRRYFEGVYGSSGSYGDILEPMLKGQMSTLEYYAGTFRNYFCGSDVPAPYYAGTIGRALDTKGGTIPGQPWSLKGLRGIGKVNGMFSCMTPIFVQEPLDVVCKIGQPATFHSLAVDYHTIPEDKINKGYPEIDFWVDALKLSDTQGQNVYPIDYRWYRINKGLLAKYDGGEYRTDAAYHPSNTVNGRVEIQGVIDLAEPAHLTGYWACLEGMSGVGEADCTLFHPRFSMPLAAQCTQGCGRGDVWTEEGEPPETEVSGSYYSFDLGATVGSCGGPVGTDWAQHTYEDDCVDNGGTWTSSEGLTLTAGYWPNYKHIEAWAPAGYAIPQYMTNIQGATVAGGGAARVPTPAEVTAGVTESVYGAVNPTYGGSVRVPQPASPGDEDYYYFCVASGRFGFRRSEMTSLDIEDWVKIDCSIRNGAPVSFGCDSIVLHTEDPFGNKKDISLRRGFGASSDPKAKYQLASSPIPGFIGTEKDPNQVWENVVKEHIRMSNNCTSYSFIGMEGFRGTLRTFSPPTQHGVRGTKAVRANYFEYGMLYPFGKVLSQDDGNRLYGRAPFGNSPADRYERPYKMGQGHHLPRCRNGEIPLGGLGIPFDIGLQVQAGAPNMDGEGKNLLAMLPAGCDEEVAVRLAGLGAGGGEGEAGSPPAAGGQAGASTVFHWSVVEPATIVTDCCSTGVPPSRMHQFGELYPYGEGDITHDYYPPQKNVMGLGVTWQFSNNMGTIKRFGWKTPRPPVISSRGANAIIARTEFALRNPLTRLYGGTADSNVIMEYADTPDVYFWHGFGSGLFSQMHEFNTAKNLVGPDGLGGINCGWRTPSGGRFMLYFVENLMRYYVRCDVRQTAKGKGEGIARSINKSYIAPGLRWGSSSIQYFWGGMPYSTFLRREPMYGPYAFHWKTMNHNRDRNGNGLSEGFYSMKGRRGMPLYDPPAIFGLYARQQWKTVRPEVKRIRFLRRAAWVYPSQEGGNVVFRDLYIKGTRFGRHGMKTGCGTIRLSCTPDRREDSSTSVTTAGHYMYRPPYIGNSPVVNQCRWLDEALRFGIDPGSFYGCNEFQLLRGVCFDPCLSMKYNYGFVPGGKILSLNNFVKYREHRSVYKNADGSDSSIADFAFDPYCSRCAELDPVDCANINNAAACSQAGGTWVAGGVDEISQGEASANNEDCIECYIASDPSKSTHPDYVSIPGNSYSPFCGDKTKSTENRLRCIEGAQMGGASEHNYTNLEYLITENLVKVTSTSKDSSQNGPCGGCEKKQGKIDSAGEDDGGARYITQLSSSVHDEEIEINVDPAGKLRRILRGPWATPYRQIKAKEHNEKIGTSINTAPVNFPKRGGSPHSMTIDPTYGYGGGGRKSAVGIRTDTSVSSCNTRGADHCNYMTMTLHINMDSRVHAMNDMYNVMATALAGGYSDSEEFSYLSEWFNFGGKALENSVMQSAGGRIGQIGYGAAIEMACNANAEGMRVAEQNEHLEQEANEALGRGDLTSYAILRAQIQGNYDWWEEFNKELDAQIKEIGTGSNSEQRLQAAAARGAEAGSDNGIARILEYLEETGAIQRL
jgi:hypothetical protein